MKIKEFELADIAKTDVNVETFFKKVLALPFLPPLIMEQIFNTIVDDLGLNLRQLLSRFITYYRRFWISIITPKGFSVHGLVARTNNILESHNCRLKEVIGIKPKPWDFFSK